MLDNPKRAIYLFLQLTLVFSTIVWIPMIWSGHIDMGFGLMIPAIMWCPALAALVTCRMLGREFQALAWRWPETKYMVAAYCLPVLYTSVAYGAVWSWQLGGWNSEFVSLVAQGFGLHGLPAWGSLVLYIVSMATGGMILNLATALGEEIGWRGFLVPELAKRFSFTKVSLFSGIVWAAWHSPLLLFADYNAGTNHWYALGCSTATLVSMSFILTWLRMKSDSLWPAALLHASHNLFVPGVFDKLVRNTGLTFWYTTEFGVALTITVTVCALYFWTRRTEVEQIATKRIPRNTSAIAAEAGAD